MSPRLHKHNVLSWPDELMNELQIDELKILKIKYPAGKNYD